MEDAMRSTTAFAALIAIAFAAASASNALAQSSAPGSTPPPKPNKVTSVPPPPPPPGGPDKYTTRTQPPGPGAGPRKPREPGVVDDFAADPNRLPSTCHAALGGVRYLNCVASLVAICEQRGGTLSGTSTSVTCNTN
jgi:hypothetical protein